MWLKDPSNNNQESATLTLWVASVVACIVGAGLHMAGKADHTSIILELQFSLSAVYVGRRMSFRSKNYELGVNGKKDQEPK